MRRTLEPASRRWVAKEWRRLWRLACLTMPAPPRDDPSPAPVGGGVRVLARKGLRRRDAVLAALAVAHETGKLPHLAADDATVEEEERGERLGLRRGAHALVDRQMRDEGVDLGRGHVDRVTDAVEADEAAHPEAVCLLGAAAVVTRAQGGAHLVHQLGHGRVLHGWSKCGGRRLRFNG